MPDGSFSRMPTLTDLHAGKLAPGAKIQDVAQTHRDTAIFVKLTNRFEVGGIERR